MTGPSREPDRTPFEGSVAARRYWEARLNLPEGALERRASGVQLTAAQRRRVALAYWEARGLGDYVR